MRPPRIALFGGTFDPIHLGHTAISRAAVDQLDLDKVVFIPCRQSPHKDEAARATEEQRLEMLDLALTDLPWAEVSEIETCLPPPSYSWMTAECMREIFPGARLYWLVGEDQWNVIESWSRPYHLAEMVEFIVHHRGGHPAPKPGFRAHFIPGDHPASGTTIREDAPTRLRSEWIHPNVERFIRSNGLYGCGD
ncbi:MAG: nicotinate (nicotinamide) nucleotide adenylyltransferase [Verrucomicrobia bacterium]|nr:nicotinate (nicotinamide) nucleotide adenylyltransferase [Verrucomicrobiota bacterium]MDA1005548.1 nicotinate (nicotinamide) nucleotide adenylyltransferase [Verrucomicrobiota bacterium]